MHDDERDLDILAVFIRNHNFSNQMLSVRGDRSLANVLNKLAKLHRQTFLTLKKFF